MYQCRQNMRITLLMGMLIAFLPMLSYVFAQTAGWTAQQSGTSVILEDIHFIDANTGWAVGWDETILHTDDGGQNWITQRSNPNGPWIYGVFFLDANTGWAALDNGSVLHTVDGGNNWSVQTSGWNYLLDVYFIDANNGWVIGGIGTILNTTDGGVNWSQQPTGQNTDFYAAKFFDENTGVAVGYQGNIMQTTDGGTNWSQQSIGATGSFNGVSFIDNNNGWAVGGDIWNAEGAISHTTDGGKTWSAPTIISNTDFSDVYFTDAQNGWIVGAKPTGGAIIYHTSDGGANWEEQSFNVSIPNLKSISFIDSNTGWIAGDDGVILHTKSGGVVALESEAGSNISNRFSLEQNYPNPFNPSTTIRFSIAKASHINLTVYDLAGREVSKLLDENMPAGIYSRVFKAQDLTSGVYFYRLKADGFEQTRRLMLLK